MTKMLLSTAIVVASLELLPSATGPGAPTAVFTAAQAAAGRAAYESVCVNCHTYALTGRTGEPGELPAVSSLPEMFQKTIQQANGRVPALAGEAFLKRWSTRTTQQFATRIRVAIDGFPPKGLDDKTQFDLAAYFLETSGATAGSLELGTPETLDVQIGSLAPDRSRQRRP